jgi:chemotaxis protein MotB
MRKILSFSMVTLLALSSCVPAKHLEEAKNKLKTCESELEAMRKKSAENEALIAELNEKTTSADKSLAGLRRDTTNGGSSYRALAARYDKLNGINDQLTTRLQKIISENDKDRASLRGNLQMTQEQLMKREDELKALETMLNKHKSDLDELNTELKKREARMNELEDILKKKEKASADLKKKLSDALVGFENKGLTITQRNGKVYVSLDESLLFASGKTNVEPKGAEALRNVAKVLEQNPDIHVMVEGHTDDVPMHGNGEIRDNWDLSVMRATSVTKILLSSARLDGGRITSAGRGEYFPLEKAKTPEARRKNRRTEIILTPRLEEVIKVLESN